MRLSIRLVGSARVPPRLGKGGGRVAPNTVSANSVGRSGRHPSTTPGWTVRNALAATGVTGSTRHVRTIWMHDTARPDVDRLRPTRLHARSGSDDLDRG